jgi:two-component system, NtrC family, sensor kinase
MKRSILKVSWISPLLVVGTTIATIGMAYYSYQSIYSLTLDSLKKNAFLATQTGAQDIDLWLSNLKIHTETLANTEIVRSLDWSVTEPYLKTEIPHFTGVYTIAVGTSDGWRHAVGAKPVSIQDRPYFQKAMAGATNVSDPLISRALQTPSIAIAAPIRSESGSTAVPTGEIHTLINLDRVSQVVNQLHYGNQSYAFALSSEGKAIVHPHQAWVSTFEKPAPSLVKAADPALAMIAQRMVSKQQGMELVQIDGTWQYVAYLPLKTAEWSIALVIPRANVEAPLQALNLLVAVIAGLLILLMGFLWRVKFMEQRVLRRSNQALESRVADRTAELSNTLAQLQQSQTQLQQANEVLEERVTERTFELCATLNELQHSQSRLIQSEKMSSLGQLVAGVAHEINNPVNFIYGNLVHVNNYAQDLINLVGLYQHHHSPPHPTIHQAEDEIELDFLIEDMPQVLTSMKMGATRIKDIVLSLRIFSRMDEAEVKAVDIHQGIDSTLVILGHRLKATAHRSAIEVVKAYGDLPLVECYAGQLNQVFMNILGNAIDALEETTLKQPQYLAQITIQTAVVDGRVNIAISDNGPGMAEAVRRNIFNPFFTTKPIGKGTGMGLGISYQIITERHGGTLDCTSALGQGTTLAIQIPMVLASQPASPPTTVLPVTTPLSAVS